MSLFNGCGFDNDNTLLWFLIIIVIICCCGCGNGLFGNDNVAGIGDCGCR